MFGIGMGPDANEKTQYGDLSSASGFATTLGEQDLAKGSEFEQAILSGDPGKISQALAAPISAAKTSAQQQNKTTAEFGTRSGGTTASVASTNDKIHADITNLLGSLTGSAASGLMSTGASSLSTGISGTDAAFNAATKMRQQTGDKWNDVFKSAADIGAGVLGAIPAGPGGFADVGSNVLGAM